MFDLARDQKFSVVDFEQIPESDWVSFPAGTSHWTSGFAIPRLVTDADYVVSTCCLKTHGFGGVFTMSLKLAVGLTPKPIRRSHARVSRHAPHDCRAQHRVPAQPDRARRRRGVHRRRAVDAAN